VQLKPVTSTENARMLPVSMKTLSVAWTVQVPAEPWPPNAESGCAGVNVPVHGAPACGAAADVPKKGQAAR
jgi:hypothetical protein